jgi:hypothetical protein
VGAKKFRRTQPVLISPEYTYFTNANRYRFTSTTRTNPQRWCRSPECWEAVSRKIGDQYEETSRRALVPISLLGITALSTEDSFMSADATPILFCLYYYGSQAAHWPLRLQSGSARSFHWVPDTKRHRNDSVGCVGAEHFNFRGCANPRSRKAFGYDRKAPNRDRGSPPFAPVSLNLYRPTRRATLASWK